MPVDEFKTSVIQAAAHFFLAVLPILTSHGDGDVSSRQCEMALSTILFVIVVPIDTPLRILCKRIKSPREKADPAETNGIISDKRL